MMDKFNDDLKLDEKYFDAMVNRLVYYYKNHTSKYDPLSNGQVRLWGLGMCIHSLARSNTGCESPSTKWNMLSISVH